MKSKIFSTVLSLALLTTVALSASEQSSSAQSPENGQETQIHLSAIELQEIFSNPTRSYVYVGREVSDIANVIAEISKLEDNQDSAVWGLVNHIERGFVIGHYDAVAQALEEAELLLSKHADTLDVDRAADLSRSLNNIIEQVIEERLSLDADLLSFLKDQVNVDEDATKHSRGLRLLVIKEKVDFLGKTKFKEDVTFYDDVKFKDEVVFEDDVTINGTLSVTNEIIGCDLTVGCNISINDSISPAIGNIVKSGTTFISNFGIDNTFVGKGSGNFTMTGTGQNSGFGVDTLAAVTTGTNNTAVGFGTLADDTTGFNNTAVGVNALITNTTGFNNTAVGVTALANNTIGFQNIALGLNALLNNTTGSNNIAIGISAGTSLITGSNNIYIGADAAAAGESNVTRIGGIRGATTGVADAIAVLIDSTGQLGTINSTRRVKHNIADMNNESAAIYNLRPVTFAYNGDATETKQYGLIAEEANEVFPAIVVHDADGQPQTIQYHVLPALMLNELQKLAARVAALEARA
jgi:hypothetical protein